MALNAMDGNAIRVEVEVLSSWLVGNAITWQPLPGAAATNRRPLLCHPPSRADVPLRQTKGTGPLQY